jgi:CheY-like chemotaxis protein
MQKALIVDDSRTAQKVLGMQLKKLGVPYDAVDSGEGALDYLQTQTPDIIFLDHMMPGMDGFQTLQAIKSNTVTKSIPVVMFTSQSAQKYIDEAKVLGAIEVITKQASADIVSRALDLAAQAAELPEEIIEIETENFADVMDASMNIDEVRAQILDHLQKDFKGYFEKGMEQIRANNEALIETLRQQYESKPPVEASETAPEKTKSAGRGWFATAAIIALLVMNLFVALSNAPKHDKAEVKVVTKAPESAIEKSVALAELTAEDVQLLINKITQLEQALTTQQLTLRDIGESQSQLLEAQQLQLQSIDVMTKEPAVESPVQAPDVR